MHWAVIAVRPIAAPQGTDYRVLDLLNLVDFEINFLKNKSFEKNNIFHEGFPVFWLHPIKVHRNIFDSLLPAKLRQSSILATSKIQE